MKKIIIAIDGHSSSGKSTMAKDLAEAIGYTYIDTGAMYRAVACHAMKNDLANEDTINEEKLRAALADICIEFRPNPGTGRRETWLNGINVESAIRNIEVSSLASRIATLGFVRRHLVAMQQEMGRDKGIVMDGRDVGTVIFPSAELKIFVTASPEIRARRRLEELTAQGGNATYEAVLADVNRRDRLDSTRAESPLRQASDALLLDNSTMSRAEQQKWLLTHYYNAALQ
ncbi:MAG: (d)CMP kinase [Tannerellaceae bacterium]|jgi:cytidylate kinase|nr:(d)CMP kinase [Tannerellaceae bacterium]